VEHLPKMNYTQVTRSMFRQLQEGDVVDLDLMKLIVAMFQERDNSICRANHDQYMKKKNYHPLQRSLFHVCASVEEIASIVVFGDPNAYSSFIIFHHESKWKIIMLNISSKEIFFINPDNAVDDHWTLHSILRSINELYLPRLLGQDQYNWNMTRYEHQYYDAMERDEDSGIYIFGILLFLVQGMPIVFQKQDIEQVRLKLGHCLFQGKLEY